MKRFSRLFSLLLFFECMVAGSFAQQGNIWYFGEKAGLSFNTNPPSALLDGQLHTYEGCASICDNNGQLLFYTNGDTVWNRLHQVMLNGIGLKGNVSTSNSAIIIPRPGSSTIFYIFTAGAVETNNEGYFFSEVDMSLQGGLGAITTNKNIQLYSPSTEKITAVRHSNGVDVWVITKAFGNTEWKVFKVDCNGVNTVPVLSNAGYAIGSVTSLTGGCLKSSPDGTKVAAANAIDGNWELLEFDASTGKLSNGLVFTGPSSPSIPYGVEFSPNSKLIYVGEFSFPPNFTSGGVLQFNLSTYDSAAIAASKTVIGTSSSYVGALQLGPDNKIYCALAFSSALSVINAPDLPGVACNFVDFQVNLFGRISRNGLPVYFPSVITNNNADFTYTISSDCATINFSGSTTIVGNVNWTWDFGDGTTGTGQQVSHAYTANGPAVDTVTLTVTSVESCGSAVVVKQIAFDHTAPVAEFGFTKACGSLSVSFHDSSATSGPSIQNWSWDFGDGNVSTIQNPVNPYAAPGSYTVKLSVQSIYGCISDTFSKTILIEEIPEVSFTNSEACIGEQIQFTNTSSMSSGTINGYAWDFGDGSTSADVNPVHTYNQNGDFTTTLTAFTVNGCTATSTKTFHIAPVRAFAGNDTAVAIGQPVQLHASGGQQYQWSPPDFLNADNIFNPVAILDNEQTYRVKVTTEQGCIGFDDITIRVLKGPDIYVPSGFSPDGKNKIFRPILVGIQELYNFSVYNRWGQLVFTTREPGKGWDGRINGITQPTGAFVWMLEAKDYQGRVINKKGTVVLIR